MLSAAASQADHRDSCRPVWETGNPNGKVDDLAVFHYLTKSKEDYMAKMARGGGAGNFREWSHYRQIERCEPSVEPESLRRNKRMIACVCAADTR